LILDSWGYFNPEPESWNDFVVCGVLTYSLHLPCVELRHLNYFVAVAEVLNYRAAAEALHVSASALSRQIKDLEEELGVRLLDRDTQSVRLTNSGAVFLAEVRKILARVKHAAELAREAEQGRRGHLVIGTMGRTLAHRMPQCLTSFQKRYPDIHVELVEMDYAEQFTALENGTLDIGFMPTHVARPLGARFQQETVLSTPIFAVLGRKHRLAKARGVALADLAGERLLFLEPTKTSISADYARALFSNRGLEPREIAEVKGFQTLIAKVAAGQGASLLGFESSVASAPGVVLRPLKETGADLKLQFCAAHRDSVHKTGQPAHRFIAVLREAVAKATI
jgi:DNA-binding transcriptional LysR family regulator